MRDDLLVLVAISDHKTNLVVSSLRAMSEATQLAVNGKPHVHRSTFAGTISWLASRSSLKTIHRVVLFAPQIAPHFARSGVDLILLNIASPTIG